MNTAYLRPGASEMKERLKTIGSKFGELLWHLEQIVAFLSASKALGFPDYGKKYPK